MNSTKVKGSSQPAEWIDAGEALADNTLAGCWMPKGPLVPADKSAAYDCQYNEVSYHCARTFQFSHSQLSTQYVVYNADQIKIKLRCVHGH